MLNEHQKELVAFVQDHAGNLPVRQRIKVYLGLCDIIKVPEVKQIFSERAAILEEADRRCRELNLNFNGGAQ